MPHEPVPTLSSVLAGASLGGLISTLSFPLVIVLSVSASMTIATARWNLLVLAGLLTLAGCASTPTEVNTGPIRASTFTFVRPGAKPTPAYAESRAAIHTMVQEAIANSLSTHGLSRADADADLTVAYLIITGNNASTASINDYFGYGRDADELLIKAHDAYDKSKNPNYFEAGTLVLDLIDSRTYKLLKRGHATRPILQNITPETRAARIQEVVDEIFADLKVEPPAAGG